MKTLEQYAPGLGELIEARQVITPEDFETEYGLSGGHVYHAEPGLDQFFMWRPLNGQARYRFVLDGLVPGGLRRPPGRRHHRWPRSERRATDPEGREGQLVAGHAASGPARDRTSSGRTHVSSPSSSRVSSQPCSCTSR